jgi:hypothetical protein
MSKVDHVHGGIGIAVVAKLEEPLRLTSNRIFVELNARQVNLAIFLLGFQRLANKVGYVAKPASFSSPLVNMLDQVNTRSHAAEDGYSRATWLDWED